MKLWTVCVCLSVCAYACGLAEALTNQELFDILEPYAEDVEDYNPDEYSSSDEAEDAMDELTFPGGPDDDVDLGILMAALGNVAQEKSGVSWWHHKYKHHCHCHHDFCGCCAEHSWKINLVFKHFKAHIKACIAIEYVAKNHGYELTIRVNGHRLYHKEIFNLKHPPSMCVYIPGLWSFARACLEMYDVNIQTKHVCVRLAGVLDLKIYEWKIHLKLGCFRIPILEKGLRFIPGRDAFKMLVEQVADLGDDVGDDVIIDLTEKFRQLQDSEE